MFALITCMHLSLCLKGQKLFMLKTCAPFTLCERSKAVHAEDLCTFCSVWKVKSCSCWRLVHLSLCVKGQKLFMLKTCTPFALCERSKAVHAEDLCTFHCVWRVKSCSCWRLVHLSLCLKGQKLFMLKTCAPFTVSEGSKAVHAEDLCTFHCVWRVKSCSCWRLVHLSLCLKGQKLFMLKTCAPFTLCERSKAVHAEDLYTFRSVWKVKSCSCWRLVHLSLCVKGQKLFMLKTCAPFTVSEGSKAVHAEDLCTFHCVWRVKSCSCWRLVHLSLCLKGQKLFMLKTCAPFAVSEGSKAVHAEDLCTFHCVWRVKSCSCWRLVHLSLCVKGQKLFMLKTCTPFALCERSKAVHAEDLYTFRSVWKVKSCSCWRLVHLSLCLKGQKLFMLKTCAPFTVSEGSKAVHAEDLCTFHCVWRVKSCSCWRLVHLSLCLKGQKLFMLKTCAPFTVSEGSKAVHAEDLCTFHCVWRVKSCSCWRTLGTTYAGRETSLRMTLPTGRRSFRRPWTTTRRVPRCMIMVSQDWRCPVECRWRWYIKCFTFCLRCFPRWLVTCLFQGNTMSRLLRDGQSALLLAFLDTWCTLSWTELN